MLDSGYDAPRIVHLLDGCPSRSSAACAPTASCVGRHPHAKSSSWPPQGGRPPKHGGEFVSGELASWGAEQAVTTTDTRLYGKATAQAWDRLRPRPTHRAAWLDHDGPLPVNEGTVIRLVVEKLPSGAVSK
ncbi:hypothetical protein [Streptomyces panacea]|uniref:hypothetical protein n=1 Tax=Streptomyces panacea TaxID=3035064 RepID=UPI003F49C161